MPDPSAGEGGSVARRRRCSKMAVMKIVRGLSPTFAGQIHYRTAGLGRDHADPHQPADDRFGNLEFGQVHELHAVVLGDGLHDLGGRKGLQFDERVLQLDASAGGQVLGFGKLIEG